MVNDMTDISALIERHQMVKAIMLAMQGQDFGSLDPKTGDFTCTLEQINLLEKCCNDAVDRILAPQEPHPDDLDVAWERADKMHPDTRIRNRSALSAILSAVADNQLRRRMDAISAARAEMEPGDYPEEQSVNEPAEWDERAERTAFYDWWVGSGRQDDYGVIAEQAAFIAWMERAALTKQEGSTTLSDTGGEG